MTQLIHKCLYNIKTLPVIFYHSNSSVKGSVDIWLTSAGGLMPEFFYEVCMFSLCGGRCSSHSVEGQLRSTVHCNLTVGLNACSSVYLLPNDSKVERGWMSYIMAACIMRHFGPLLRCCLACLPHRPVRPLECVWSPSV